MQAALDSWAITFSRYVGLAGCIAEVVIDRWRHPTVVIVFGGMAAGPSVARWRRALRDLTEDTDDEEP